MPRVISKPWCKKGLGEPLPSNSTEIVSRLLEKCLAHSETPLRVSSDLAIRYGVAAIAIHYERNRIGLASLKALGAPYAIAREAGDTDPLNLPKAPDERTFVQQALETTACRSLSVPAYSSRKTRFDQRLFNVGFECHVNYAFAIAAKVRFPPVELFSALALSCKLPLGLLQRTGALSALCEFATCAANVSYRKLAS
jgi:hypothetical protein